MTRNRSEPLPSTARTRLAALGEKKPVTKAAQLRILWPEIKAALDNGHSLKAVCECLEADGLKITVHSLGSYLTRMRRSAKTTPAPSSHPSRIAVGAEVPKVASRQQFSALNLEERTLPDSVVNMRERQEKPLAFDYRPELADPDKLI